MVQVMKALSTKEKIFHSAVALFSTQGYHGTSIRQLAAKVGIKESSIYNHYPSKKAIFQAILDYQMQGFNQSMESLKELEKMGIPHVKDPVEFWMAGTREFIKHQPPLTQTIGLIISNEMFLNEQCRHFVLNQYFKAQKELTASIFTAMQGMGMIQEFPIEDMAEQYVYMIQGLDMENRLLLLQGESPERAFQQLEKHMRLFLENLKMG